jgi:hypothetical protein
MSAYVQRQLKILMQPHRLRINLIRSHANPQELLGSGFKLPGFRLLSVGSLRRRRAVDQTITCAGVYFLWEGDRLVYIGSGESVWMRVRSHMLKGVHGFNYATYLAIDFPWYLSVEAAYIVAYTPTGNKRHLW